MAATTVGLDTGFFLRLLAGHDGCVSLWRRLLAGEVRGVVSCLSLAELRRLGLRGHLEAQDADLLLEAIPAVCEVVWLDSPEALERAAHLSHGTGLPLVDALIVASLEAAGATEVWTTDADLERCQRQGMPMRLLQG